MSERRPKNGQKNKNGRGPTLNMRLDEDTERALVAFQNDQPVEPDRTAVGLAALRQFLFREGFLALSDEEERKFITALLAFLRAKGWAIPAMPQSSGKPPGKS